MRPIAFIIGMLFWSTTQPAWTQRAERVVAEVGDQMISVAELEAFAADGFYQYLYPSWSQAYERALDDMVVETLKRSNLFGSGLSRDSALIRSVARNVREGEIVVLYYPEPPYPGSVAFALQDGEAAAPVACEDAQQGRLYAILRATQRIDERQRTYSVQHSPHRRMQALTT